MPGNEITKSFLKEHGFRDMTDYYRHIIATRERNEFSEVRNLLINMSGDQCNGFFAYLIENKIFIDGYHIDPVYSICFGFGSDLDKYVTLLQNEEREKRKSKIKNVLKK